MAQHDYTIANQTFPATRTDLNNALAATVTQNSGATAPSTTYAYMLWYDTTANILKQRNANDDAWIDLFDVDQVADTATPSAGGGTTGIDDNSTATTITIDSSNNVGIGLSSNISSKLHVNTEMSIGADGDNRAIIGYTPSRFYIGTRQSGTNYFDTFNVRGGNVLVGTTTSRTGSDSLSFEPANSLIWFQKNGTATQSQVIFQRNTTGTPTIVGSIQTSGSSTSYNTSSDYRLKTAVNYDWDATTRLKQLRPARFEWISEGDDAVPVDGFLAHEVQDVVPEAISGTKDAMRDEEYQVSAATGDIYTPAIDAVLDEDGNEVTPAVAEVIHSTDVERPEELAEGQQWRETTAAVMGTRSVPDYQGIDQSKLVPLLVKTIQELEARITALEA